MSVCGSCGKKIKHRYIRGVVVPLGCRCPREEKLQTEDPESFCRPTKCPKCANAVYFIRHNGGSVWLDQLGQPWPRHGCFLEDENATAFFRLLEKIPLSPNGKMTVVCRAKWEPEIRKWVLLVRYEDSHLGMWFTDEAGGILKRGQIGIFDSATRQFISASGECFELSDSHTRCATCQKWFDSGDFCHNCRPAWQYLTEA